MSVRALTFLVVGSLLIATATAQSGGARKDAEKLKGTWVVVAHENDGRPEPVSKTKPGQVVITDDTITISVKDKLEGTTYKVDASKRPHTIDMTCATGKDKGKMVKGIYELSGNELKICFAQPGAERPTDFRTRPGSHQMSCVLKRAAP